MNLRGQNPGAYPRLARQQKAVNYLLDPLMPMRPCWVEINTRALEDNYRFLAGLAAPHAEFLAIVKATPTAIRLRCVLQRWHAPALAGWASPAWRRMAARALCPQARILVIGGVFPGQGAAVIRHNLTAVAWEPCQLDGSNPPRARPAVARSPVHLELDTGMSRQGVSCREPCHNS